jgi:transglutaminase-like putative cysteine protease
MKDTRKKENHPVIPVPQPGSNPLVSRWGNWRTWLNLMFLLLTLGITVFSIEQAHWIEPQPYFTLVLFSSVAVVWLLVVARLPGWALHLVAIAVGALVILWQGSMILPGGSNLNNLFTIFRSWWQGGTGLQENEAKIIFGILLVFLVWLTGYLSTWFVLRRNNAWVAVLMGLIIIIVNLSNLPEKIFVLFTLFLLAAVLLIIQTNIVRQQVISGSKASYSGKSMFYLVMSLFCITVLAVSIAWGIPQIRLSALQNTIASGMPWKSSVQESGLNILNAVPSKKSISTTANLQDLTFGESWNAGDDIKYTVISPQPAYWQVIVYDNYTSKAWTSTSTLERLLETRTKWEDTGEISGRTRVRYEVTPNLNTDVMLMTGDFVSAEMPVLARLGVEDEIIGAKAPRILSAGEKYAIRVYVADNSAKTLSAAGDNYTEAIKTAYLQLPIGFPQRIRILSENLTGEADTPYEKVLAIDKYLAGIPYSQEVEKLPEGADAVWDFLFTQEKGFCLHFASAMTVMLRSVGVPARLAVGYLPGDPGEVRGTYLLRDKHYHAWTQVYFPAYGWIDFEPTPAGTSGSQVPLNESLVSVSNIGQLPAWDLWYYPAGSPIDASFGAQAAETEARTVNTGELPFSDELGIAVIIIMGALVAFALIFGLTRVIRPFYSRQLWDVDRDNLASSAYGNLYLLAEMNNLFPSPQQTPLEFSSQIAKIIPEQSKNLDLLVQSYLDKRFGPDKGKLGLYEEAEILKARVLVYNAIIKKKGKIHQLFLES